MIKGLHQPHTLCCGERISIGIAQNECGLSPIASRVNADVLIDQLPTSPTLAKQTEGLRRQCAANGGDDYELCFTAPTSKRMEVESLSTALLPLTRIGSISSASNGTEPTLILRDANGNLLTAAESMRLMQSFDHFKSN